MLASHNRSRLLLILGHTGIRENSGQADVARKNFLDSPNAGHGLSAMNESKENTVDVGHRSVDATN